MNGTRRIASIVGALFLVAMAASLVGGAMVEGVLAGPGYLARVAGGTPTLTTGVILELVNAVAVVGIAVALFPLFRRDGQSMALGYVVLRILEAGALIVAAVVPLRLVGVGRAHLAAGATPGSSFQLRAESLLAARATLTGTLVPLFFCLGALLLYAWLYRSRRLPRFIPVWGMVGVAGIAALNLFAVGGTAGMLLALPIISNELFLGAWLLFRGFGRDVAGPTRAVPA